MTDEVQVSGTRERILAVAAELFVEQGYEGTSLREIADRLGVTKAALYYHFRSKEEILRALLAPFEALVEEMLLGLEAAHDVDDWADALTAILGKFFDSVDYFRLVDRNRHIVEAILVEARQDHAEMHGRVEAAAHAAATSLGEEVRMIAALAAVTGFDDWAPELFGQTDPELLRGELTAVVRDVLGIGRKVPSAG